MPHAQSATRLSADHDPFDPILDLESALDDDAGAHTRTVEVQTIFRGVGLGSRILAHPSAARRHATGARFLAGGLALIACALGVFAAVASGAQGSWIADVAFFGCLLAGVALAAVGLARRGHPAGRAHGRADFRVGAAAGVDAPVDVAVLPSPSHALVTAIGDDHVVVNTTAGMRGEVAIDGQIFPLAEVVRERGPSWRLPPGASARLTCGQTTFVVVPAFRPEAIATPWFAGRWHDHAYTAATAVAHALFLVMLFSIPPDPRSLSLDLLGSENHMIQFQIKPPADNDPLLPAWLTKHDSAPPSGQGHAHAGPSGAMGEKTSRNHDGRYALAGPKDNRDPRLAKQAAADDARTHGILGVLAARDQSPLASIFGAETALGSDAKSVLGNMMGTNVAEAWGVGGLGIVGTGSGGADTGRGTIGTGHLGVIGSGDGPTGDDWGRRAKGIGQLGPRHARTPDYLPGDPNVRGSLDKEIVRRTVRRHLNEVKYCYEQELVRRPALAGRIQVQFTIAGNGQVISSVLSSSTMANAQVERCTVDAVRRWQFPQPQGGGLVMVSYPFVLAPAGG